MKKLFLLFLVLFLNIMPVFSKGVKAPQVNFDGKNFTLKYSQISNITGTYLNEYYTNNEKYSNWTEMIAVYYYPNQKSPIKAAQKLNDKVASMGRPAEIVVNKKGNSAIVCIMTGSAGIPQKIELNTFKYAPAENGGTISMQYAHRYFINNETDVNKMNENIAANRTRWLQLVMAAPIPKLIEKPVDLGN